MANSTKHSPPESGLLLECYWRYTWTMNTRSPHRFILALKASSPQAPPLHHSPLVGNVDFLSDTHLGEFSRST